MTRIWSAFCVLKVTSFSYGRLFCGMLFLDRLDDYEGPLPLFPLPNVVLFPNTFLPLHVFESRYRQMVKDTTERDGFIGMVLLKPGWENSYEENPPVFPVTCIGRIVHVETLEDGRCNILLYGLSRAKIERIESHIPYRKAKVKIMQEKNTPFNPRRESEWRHELFEAFTKIIEPPHWGFTVFSAPHLEMGVLADLMAYFLPCQPFEKQRVLEALSPGKRLDELVKILGALQVRGQRLRMKEIPFVHELARS